MVLLLRFLSLFILLGAPVLAQNGGLWVHNSGRGAAAASGDFHSHADGFSVEFWVRPHAAGTVITWNTAGKGLVPYIRITDQGKVLIQDELGSVIQSKALVTFDEWNHVAMTYGSEKWLLYVNGTETAASTLSEIKFSAVDGMTIGCRNTQTIDGTDTLNHYSDHFSGVLDDVRFWHKTLTEHQLATLMVTNALGTHEPKVFWDFEAFTDDTTPDVTGNGNTLTINDALMESSFNRPVGTDLQFNSDRRLLWVLHATDNSGGLSCRLYDGTSSSSIAFANNGGDDSFGASSVNGMASQLGRTYEVFVNGANIIEFEATLPNNRNGKEVFLVSSSADFSTIEAIVATHEGSSETVVNGLYDLSGDVETMFVTVARTEDEEGTLTSTKGLGPFTEGVSNVNDFVIHVPAAVQQVAYSVHVNDHEFTSGSGTSVDSLNFSLDMGTLESNTVISITYTYAAGFAVKQVVPLSIVEPAPTIAASSGWGPFTIGDSTVNTFTVTDLDDNVTAVTFVITDVNKVPQVFRRNQTEVVFDSLRITGNPVTEAEWTLQMADIRLPLSAQLGVFVQEGAGSRLLRFYRPLQMVADPDWDSLNNEFGPFVTNRYVVNTDPNSSFDSVPTLRLDYNMLDIPPRTSEAVWAFYDRDSTIVAKYDLLRNPNLTQTHVTSEKFTISELPLTTRYMEMQMKSDGGPEDGVVLRRDIYVLPQKPHIYASQGWGPFQQRNDRDSLDGATQINEVRVYPASANADSVRYYWLQRDGEIFDSVTMPVETNGEQQYAELSYDMRSLSYHVDSLLVRVFYPEGRPDGITNGASIGIMAPRPLLYSRLPLEQQVDGQIVVNDILLNGLPDGTVSATVRLKRGLETVRSDEITEEAVPYHSFAEMTDGENYIVSENSASALGNFSASIWFRTTSNEGGKLFGYESSRTGSSDHYDRHLYMDNDGRLHFGMIVNDQHHVLSTEYTFNDSRWHHATVVYHENEMRLFVDGCQIADSTVTGNTDSYDGYWRIGDGNLNGWFAEPESESFPGFLTEFAVWGDPLVSRNVARVMTMGADSAGIAPYHYYSFEEYEGGSSIVDRAGGNTGEIIGNVDVHVNPDIDRVSFAFPDYLLKGVHSIELIIDYPESVDADYVYKLREFDVADNWWFDADDATISSSAGFGWFSEGMETSTRIEFNLGSEFTDWLNEINGLYEFEDFFAILSLYDTQTHEFLVEKELSLDVDDGNVTGFFADLDLDKANPHTILLLDFEMICTDQGGDEIPCDNDFDFQEYRYPLWTRPLIPPLVSGRFGTYIQPIIPGTMEYDEIYEIVTFADGVSFKLEAFSSHERTAVGGDVTQINDTLFHLKYNMASLPVNTTEVYINTYSSDGTELEAQNGPHFVSIIPTRPVWFDKMVEYTDVVENSSEVVFHGVANINPVGAAQAGGTDYFDNPVADMLMPAWMPIIADMAISFFPANVTVPMKFTKSNLDLELNGTPYSTTGLKLFGTDFKGHNVDFSESGSRFYRLDANKNFEAYQLHSSSIGHGGIPIKSSYNGLKRLYAVMKDVEELEDADIVGPTASIGFDIGAARGQNFNLGMEGGEWGSKGDLSISQSGFSSASFETASITLGLSLSLGIEAGFGIAEADFILSGDGEVGFGYSYHQLPSNDSKFLKAASVHLYGKAQIKVFWGLYTKTIWGPRTFYYHHWGDDIPHWWPSSSNGFVWNNLGTKRTDDIITVDNVDALSRHLVYADVFPHSEIIGTSDGVSMFWFDQDPASGVGTLTMSGWNNADSTFSSPTPIVSNRNGMNGVEVAKGETSTLAVWAQSRLEPEDLYANMPYNEVFKAQDIHLAALLESNEVSMLTIVDDHSSLNSGRAEGQPRVANIAGDSYMVVWTAADAVAKESSLWYSIVSLDGDEWNMTTPVELAAPGGVQRNVRVEKIREGQVTVGWLNGDPGTDENNRTLAMVYTAGTWNSPTVVGVSSDTTAIQSFDMAFSQEGGVSLTLISRVVGDSVVQDYQVAVLPTGSFGWSQAHVGTFPQHAQYPRVDISPSGNIAAAFTSPSQMKETAHHSDVHIMTSSWSNTGEWDAFTNHMGAHDPTKKVSEFDIAYGTDDYLFLVSQELDKRNGTAPSAVNGVQLGEQVMEQVLRVVCVENGTMYDVDEDTWEKVVSSVDDEVSIPEVAVQALPNPATSVVTVKSELTSGLATVQLVDLHGRIVAEQLIQATQEAVYTVEFDVATLNAGQYYVQVTQNNVSGSVPVVVIR